MTDKLLVSAIAEGHHALKEIKEALGVAALGEEEVNPLQDRLV